MFHVILQDCCLNLHRDLDNTPIKLKKDHLNGRNMQSDIYLYNKKNCCADVSSLVYNNIIIISSAERKKRTGMMIR